MDCFDRWKVTHAGVYTFSQSAKHLALYQKYGFWPRFLTAIMSKPVQHVTSDSRWSKYSELSETEHVTVLNACRALTNGLYPGFDLEHEIRAVLAQGLGDTVLIWDGSELAGVAVCHCGPGTEAGNEKCYVKFG